MSALDPALPTPATSRDERPGLLWAALLLSALGFLTVSGCLTAPLLNMDDNIQVTENPFLQPDHNWWEAFSSYHYCQYIPVTHLSYRVNATFFGLETAWAYRLVNWALHVISAVVLLSTLRALGVGRTGSLFAASVWVVHPMACESVGWVTERSNVLAFFFGNLAFHYYVVRGDSWRHIALSAFLFGLALLSKPLALGWMPVFLMYEVLGGSRRLSGTEPEPVPGGVRLPALRLLPFVLLTTALTVLGLFGYQQSLRPPPGDSLFTALLTDLDIFARYAFNIVAPFRVSAFYGIDAIDSLLDPRFWGWSAFWICLSGGTMWVSVSRRRTLFGWLWFFGGLGPASNIVAVVYPMQDRFAYLSTAGLLLVLVDTASGIAARLPALQRAIEQRRRVWTAILAAWVALLGAVTLQRSELWADPIDLMQDAVEKQPDSAIAHVFLGRQLDYQAWLARVASPPDESLSRLLSRQAVEHYSKALSLEDSYLYNPNVTRMMQGGSLLHAGDAAQAIEILTSVLPPPDASRLTTDDAGKHQYTAKAGPFAFPYPFSFADVSHGHQWLAEAYLDQFMHTTMSPAEARARLDLATRHCELARQHDPRFFLTYFTKAYLFLLDEAFAAAPPEKAQRAAQTILSIARAHIDSIIDTREVLSELRPPVPAARPKAMACLGMAKASFEAISIPNSTPEQIRNYRERLFLWAQRAFTLDPEFSETYWFLAEVHQLMSNAAREQNEPAAAQRLQQQAAVWLAKIRPNSPRYQQAQSILVRMGAQGP